MPLIDVDALLCSVGNAAPCGPDLEYDHAFIQLEDAARGEPEIQYGESIVPPGGQDWHAAFTLAMALFARTTDLRVAVTLLRAAMHLNGPSEFEAGLRLIHALLRRYWDTVHPMFDSDDSNDATARLNALAPLGNTGPVLADLRSMPLGVEPDAITVRHLERASGIAPFDYIQNDRSLEVIWEALAAEETRTPDLLECLRSAGESLQGIEALLTERVGVYSYPDFGQLRRLTQALSETVRRANDWACGRPGDGPGDADPGEAPVRRVGASLAHGSTQANEEVLRQLQRVSEWMERDVPAHSLSPMLRRAHRLSSRSFIDVVRSLTPDRSDQIDGPTDPAGR